MNKKTYILTIEYDADTDTVEYVQEEIINGDTRPRYQARMEILDFFDDESIELIDRFYEIGEA